MSFPSFVKIYEVGPRDGLQNEKDFVPTPVKVELIDRLSKSGLKYIEATSFVSPKWIPQLADACDVMAGITRKDGVKYATLVPNEKGLDFALTARASEVAVFTAASDAFTQKNINCSIEESLQRFVPIIEKAKAENIPVRGYVSTVIGCPYAGDVAPQAVADVAADLMELGCYEISLGDTIGVGTPNRMQKMLSAVLAAGVPLEMIALHCHDTYGQALVNIYAGLEMGVAVIDSSVAGLGGCPYAKGASGNVATEDVLYMLAGMGIETGVNMHAVVDAACYIAEQIGRLPASRLPRALGRVDGTC
jgi:hydroxymethylglutaryl-CoA lyase